MLALSAIDMQLCDKNLESVLSKILKNMSRFVFEPAFFEILQNQLLPVLLTENLFQTQRLQSLDAQSSRAHAFIPDNYRN